MNKPRIDRAPTGYTAGEARALVAPLAGMDSGDIREFLVIGIDGTGRAGVGGSPGLDDRRTLIVLETLAAHLRDRGVTR